jgi:hypothetical protein
MAMLNNRVDDRMAFNTIKNKKIGRDYDDNMD